MKYAPSLYDFQNNFFMVDRCKDPYFLVSKKGEVLRSNRVGERFLTWFMRTHPQSLEHLILQLNERVSKPSKKVFTLLLGDDRRRVLRAVPVASGAGYLVEIDRV